jgi:hypothetical protein
MEDDPGPITADELDDEPDAETDDIVAPSAPTRPPRFPLTVRTQRTLQVILGLFWILDGGLQFQSYMFSKSFVNDVILGSADGQPPFLAAFITHIGHFLTPDIAVWNTFFALIQVAIGVGLLFRRTVRPALAISFAWALGVWVIGEGLGLLLTGTATALTGAPGSVLVYGLIGLMAWPRHEARAERTGIASSAAARGIGGVVTPVAVWTGYWSLAAVLFLLPDNRTQTSISSAIVGMASGSPRWYSHFLTSVGNQFHTTGTETAWVLAILSLVIGLGPLAVRRPGPFLALGALASLAFWVTAQGLLGGILTGSGTDPNTGPLIMLLAAAMVPTAVAGARTPPPLGALLRWSPAGASVGVLAIAAAMAISATYPVAASESVGAAMGGMVMPGDTASATPSSTTANCNAHDNGLAISGLDLNNTPYMLMAGGLGMDMNGADASAAAGLNVTKANWHYDGPALPNALARELLADGNNGPADIHMAESGCARAVSVSEEINAVQYVQATSAAVSHLSNPFEAAAAGYVAVSPTNYPVVTYVNPTIEASNAAAKRTLSPQHVDGLVYAATPSGQEVLAAAMYVLPSTVAKAPLPYGALVQWHQRTATCGPTSRTFGSNAFDVTGFPPCAAGTSVSPTPFVSLVWQVPVAGGPLAIQPPDIQIVEAAIMQAAAG